MKFSAALLTVALAPLAFAKSNSTKADSPTKQLDKQCADILKFTGEVDLANNATKLQELQSKQNLTDAEITKFKEKAANATTKLNTLKANTTLTTTCAQAKPVQVACGKFDAVKKFSELSTNTTKLQELESKKNLTQTEITKLKEQAANATTKLKTLQSNSSLVSMCDSFNSLKKSEGSVMAAINTMNNITNAGTSSTSTSGAAVVGYSGLTTAVIVGLGMIFLA